MPTQKAGMEYNSVVVCPQKISYKGALVNTLDLSFPAKCLERVDGNGVVTYMTLREYESAYGYEFPRSADGRYIALFVSLSDVNNELTDFKGLLISCGVTLGGTDYAQTADNLAWLLLIHEFVNDFKPVSPLFAVTQSEEI